MNLRESIRKYLQEQCFVNPTPPPTFGNYGCMDSTALNYDGAATHPCNAIGPNFGCANCNGQPDFCGPGTYPGDCCQYPVVIPGCTDPSACNYDTTATTDDGSCEYTSCAGCMDPTANNYDPNATIDDGSCTFSVTHLFTDCTGIVPGTAVGMSYSFLPGYDSSQPANNSQLFYNFLGTPNPGEVVKVDTANITLCIQYDGTTTQNVGVGPWNTTMTVISTHTDCVDCMNVYGCTDPIAINYDPNATIDDGSCQYPVNGCTDPLAINYDPNATVDDGSCVYEEEPEDCTNQLDIGCWICKDPINFPGCQQISNMNQVTTATGYGLQGFNTQQDCINSTQCGKPEPDLPCEQLEQYVNASNYPWLMPIQTTPGNSNINVAHFCEKCASGEINDPMCVCCKTDPCDKKYFVDTVMDQFNLEIPEFCKYCKYNVIQDSLCKCCKRFERMKIKKRLGEETINRINKNL